MEQKAKIDTRKEGVNKRGLPSTEGMRRWFKKRGKLTHLREKCVEKVKHVKGEISQTTKKKKEQFSAKTKNFKEKLTGKIAKIGKITKISRSKPVTQTKILLKNLSHDKNRGASKSPSPTPPSQSQSRSQSDSESCSLALAVVDTERKEETLHSGGSGEPSDKEEVPVVLEPTPEAVVIEDKVEEKLEEKPYDIAYDEIVPEDYRQSKLYKDMESDFLGALADVEKQGGEGKWSEQEEPSKGLDMFLKAALQLIKSYKGKGKGDRTQTYLDYFDDDSSGSDPTLENTKALLETIVGLDVTLWNAIGIFGSGSRHRIWSCIDAINGKDPRYQKDYLPVPRLYGQKQGDVLFCTILFDIIQNQLAQNYKTLLNLLPPSGLKKRVVEKIIQLVQKLIDIENKVHLLGKGLNETLVAYFKEKANSNIKEKETVEVISPVDVKKIEPAIEKQENPKEEKIKEYCPLGKSGNSSDEMLIIPSIVKDKENLASSPSTKAQTWLDLLKKKRRSFSAIGLAAALILLFIFIVTSVIATTGAVIGGVTSVFFFGAGIIMPVDDAKQSSSDLNTTTSKRPLAPTRSDDMIDDGVVDTSAVPPQQLEMISVENSNLPSHDK